MSRSIFSDELRVHQFHLIDVDPSFSFPPFVLVPNVGFSSITIPEISIETEEIQEGTSDFVHHVLKKASTNTITLSRGSTPFNSDFWRWTMACVKGTSASGKESVAGFLTQASTLGLFGDIKIPGKRRNMILLHLTGLSAEGLLEAMDSARGLDMARGLALLPYAGLSEASGLQSSLTQGLLDLGITSIPGKAYMLFGCLPTRYKPGSDFDADTTAVSIEELDLAYSHFEQFGVGA